MRGDQVRSRTSGGQPIAPLLVAHPSLPALLSLFVVLFATPALRYLPKPVMAAIIIVAVSKMADFGELSYIARQRKAEVALWVLPFVGVLLIGIDAGLLFALALCVLLK